MATDMEIKELKDSWMKDPCWDIESTEGFEAHTQELLDFRKQVEEEAEEKANVRKIKRLNKVVQETGCVNFYLKTYDEIAHSASKLTEDQAAQINATLLLAAQMERIADKLTVLISQGKKA